VRTANLKWRRRIATAIIAVLASGLATVALAGDDVTADGDAVDVTQSDPVSITVPSAGSASKTTRFTLVCKTQQHVDSGDTVSTTFDLSGSTVPPGGTLSATNGSVVRPSTWPADGTACGSPAPTVSSGGAATGNDSTVSITAPAAGGTYTYKAVWSVGGTGQANDVSTNKVSVTYNVTVLVNAAPSTPGAPVLSSGSATPNNGAFGLTWAASTDAESDPITYTLQHRDANDAGFTTVSSGISGNTYQFAPGSKEEDGTWTYRVQASDSGHSSSFSGESSAVKSDRSAPSAPAASTAPGSPAFTDAGGNAWWKDTVTVAFSAAGDPNLADGSAGSGVDAATLAGPSVFTSTGSHTASSTIKDNVANESAPTSLTVFVDAVAPTVSFSDCPASAVLQGSAASVNYSAGDAGSRLGESSTGSVALDTTSSGAHSVSKTVEDNVGHSATASCSYSVDAPPSTPGKPSASADPNSGAFTLDWSASIDPDGDTVHYVLQHKDADDAAFTTVDSSLSGNTYTFAPAAREAEGTWTYQVKASDGTFDSDYSEPSDPVKADRSAPNLPTVSTDPASPMFTDGSSQAWWKDTVTVTFASDGDPNLADGSAGSGVDAATLAGPSVFTSTGSHTASSMVKDNVANESAPTSLTVFVDADAPTVAFTDCPATPVLKDSVASIGYTAEDAGSGLVSAAAGSVGLDTSTSGMHSVSKMVEDNVGHSATASCSYLVDAPPSTPGVPSAVSPNRGGFTLAWAASTDPEGDTIQYTLQHKPATGGSWSAVASGIHVASYTFGSGSSLEDEGTWLYRVKASDGYFDSDFSDPSDPVKVDKTKPSPPLASTQPAAPDYSGGGGWFKDEVTVHFAGNGDPALADGSDGSGVDAGSVPDDLSYATHGSHSASGTVKDNAGNESDTASLTVQVDKTAPVLAFTNCPSAPVMAGSSITVTWSASDTGSGLASAATGTLTLDTTAPGPHSVTTPAATDNVGHLAGGITCTYSILRVTFESPIDGGLVMNVAKAGRVVPVKTHIFLNGVEKTGANSAAGAVTIGVGSTSCVATTATDDIEVYAAGASNTGTQFRWESNFWMYNLDTSSFRMVASSCYQVSVYLNGNKAGYFMIKITK